MHCSQIHLFELNNTHQTRPEQTGWIWRILDACKMRACSWIEEGEEPEPCFHHRQEQHYKMIYNGSSNDTDFSTPLLLLNVLSPIMYLDCFPIVRSAVFIPVPYYAEWVEKGILCQYDTFLSYCNSHLWVGWLCFYLPGRWGWEESFHYLNRNAKLEWWVLDQWCILDNSVLQIYANFYSPELVSWCKFCTSNLMRKQNI